MWTRLSVLSLCCIGLGCTSPNSGAEQQTEQTNVPLGKGDSLLLFGIDEGSAEARAVLRFASEATLDVLDYDVGLDVRAAEGIVEMRSPAHDVFPGYQTLAELDAVPFVAVSAFSKILEYVLAQDLVTQSLSLSTFNIRWFGLNGSLWGTFGSETRTESISAFIDSSISSSDVIVFQEISDVELLRNEVMVDRNCLSYQSNQSKHQFVVLCYRDGLVFEPMDDDNDLELEMLNTGYIRPGLQGTLKLTNGIPVAHVIGVHLKANPTSTDRRLEQAEILADRVDQLQASSALPIVVVGDFNTFDTDKTGHSDNDEDLISDILAPDLNRVELPVESTYQDLKKRVGRFDQGWVSDTVSVVDVSAHGPCDLDPESEGDKIAEYYTNVSDHCPIVFHFELD